ncbi:MAG TPA: hypothetical protein VIH89_05970 [Candidatus Sulfotelmatobacter sp.]
METEKAVTGQAEDREERILNLIYRAGEGLLKGLQTPLVFPPPEGSPAFEHTLREIVSDVQDRLVHRPKSALSVAE